MKPSAGFLLLALAVEGSGRPCAAAAGPAAACAPTEHMPIIGLHSRPPEPMPIVAPDSTRDHRAPVAALVPCYLVDSLRLDSTRRGWPRAREPISGWLPPRPASTRDSSSR